MSLLRYIAIEDFDYPLLPTQIAEVPKSERDNSKLLVYKSGNISDEVFHEIDGLLPTHATIVLNNSKVIAARLSFQKDTGGVIEVFCLQPHNATMEEAMAEQHEVQWRCLIGGASKWKPGTILQKKISIEGNEVLLTARFGGKEDDYFLISFQWNCPLSFAMIIENAGSIPLPPYIKRAPQLADKERYQTVFARFDGSVAAPTAALHFTQKTLQSLQDKNIDVQYVTLHVGAGTFKPVKTTDAAQHVMHAEPFSVSLATLRQLKAATTLIAVGTTSLRTLESLYWMGIKVKSGDESMHLSQWEAYNLASPYSYEESMEWLIDYVERTGKKELQGRTSLMIVPGYSFKSATALVTNFHQPRSTLLLLIAAFIGPDWKKVYEHALANDYRFLSYGDSSLLWRKS